MNIQKYVTGELEYGCTIQLYEHTCTGLAAKTMLPDGAAGPLFVVLPLIIQPEAVQQRHQAGEFSLTLYASAEDVTLLKPDLAYQDFMRTLERFQPSPSTYIVMRPTTLRTLMENWCSDWSLAFQEKDAVLYVDGTIDKFVQFRLNGFRLVDDNHPVDGSRLPDHVFMKLYTDTAIWTWYKQDDRMWSDWVASS